MSEMRYGVFTRSLYCVFDYILKQKSEQIQEGIQNLPMLLNSKHTHTHTHVGCKLHGHS